MIHSVQFNYVAAAKHQSAALKQQNKEKRKQSRLLVERAGDNVENM